MASTFLQLTNKLLRRFNEVELNSSTFGNAKGVHGLAKDSVIAALNVINQQDWQWPFNYASGESGVVTATIGQNYYDWPTNASDIDTDGVFIANDSVSSGAVQLRSITWDEYKEYLRKDALDQVTTADYDTPDYIAKTDNTRFVIHPRPDKAYRLLIPHWITPTEPTAHDSTVTIPSQFDDVIVDGAERYMYAMRTNPEQAKQSMEDGIKPGARRMYNLLIGSGDAFRSTSIRRYSGLSNRYIVTR